MKRSKRKKEKNKNLYLGLYFLISVIFIIIVSFSVKVIDVINSSKFDNNFYSVAVLGENDAQIFSASPVDGSLKKMTIKGANEEKSLRLIGIPADNYVKSTNNSNFEAKSYFSNMLFKKNGIEGSINIFDLIKLSLFSNSVKKENVLVKDVNIADESEIDSAISAWFRDPQIENENISIEVINTTEVSGLGGEIAELLSNAGGNVVLVHSSQETINESIIYFEEDSYTVGKISKILDMPVEKRELDSISEIVIQIGKDKVIY